MKSKILKKGFFCLISALLVITLLCSFAGSTVAEAATFSTGDVDINGRDEASRQDYQNLIKQIQKKAKIADANAWATKNLKEGQDVIQVTMATANAIISWAEEGGNADHIQNAYAIATSLINLGVACFGGPIAGIVTDTVLKLAETLLTMGESSESEMTKLANKLDHQFEEVHQHIDEVQRDISALSTQVDESTARILAELSAALDGAYAKGKVVEFTSSGTGNFDYNLFKEYLYASANYEDEDASNDSVYAYYNQLMMLSSENAEAGELKEAYDRLYVALNVSDQRGIKPPVELYYEYLLASAPGLYSIQRYYYDYLSSNRVILLEDGEIPEVLAIDFTYDVYMTALMADYCISLCNMYQQMMLRQQYGTQITASARYYYGTGANDYVTYGQIKSNQVQIAERQEKLLAQVLSDLAYIMGIGESFLVKEGDAFETVIKTEEATFGVVEQGQIIYLNQFTHEVCRAFDLDPSDFSYEWNLSEADDIVNEGVYEVQTSMPFVATVKYGEQEIYSIRFFFTDGTQFSGGNGTEENPYLIATREQFLMIGRDVESLKKHYRLVNDIYFTDVPAMPPLSDKLTPFEGTLDGNGYKISGIKVEDDTACGLFGYIGKDGVVKDLTIAKSTFTLVSSDQYEAYASAIAAVCSGTLYGCRVTEGTVVTVERNCTKYNQTMATYVGGLVGNCEGSVQYCGFEDATVKCVTNRHYEANNDVENRIISYGGTIAGNLSGSVSYCYNTVDSHLEMSANSVCKKGLSTRHPYITLRVGGLVGNAVNGATLVKVFAAMPEDSIVCKTGVKNEHWSGGSDQNNCKITKAEYAPGFDAETIESIKATMDELVREKTAFPEITFEFVEGGNAYAWGEKHFNEKGLIVYADGEKVDFSVLAVYNFNNQKVAFAGQKYVGVSYDVTILISTMNEICELTATLWVKENRPKALELYNSDELKTEYNYNGDAITLEIPLFKVVYEDGREFILAPSEFVASVTKLDKLGHQEVTLTHTDANGHSISYTYTVNVVHDHVCHPTVISPTCISVGYTKYDCEYCDYYYTVEYTEMLPHSIVIYDANSAEAMMIDNYRGSQMSTCTREGYTGDEFCTSCCTVISHGLKMGKESHSFSYNDSLTHKCACGLPADHLFSTIENEEKLLLICACGYTKESLTNDREAIEKLPHAEVIEAYALPGSKKVVVFIEFHAAEAINLTGAGFSVRYDNRLTYNSYRCGNLFKPATQGIKDYSGYLNVSLTSIEGNNQARATSGLLLELVFVLPENAKVGDYYEICVTSRYGADKFVVGNDACDFVAIDGGITVVERLPGDVDGDGSVDILDAMYITRYSVLNAEEKVKFIALQQSQNPNFDIMGGDVDLSGTLGETDVVRLLRYAVGGYSAKVLSPVFDVVLNYNDGKTANSSIRVNYDEGTGTYGEGVCKDGTQGLPEVHLDGYKFLGWFNSKGERVLDSTLVTPDPNQIKQTLYARYERNTVFFDANGGTGTKNPISYTPEGHSTVVLTQDGVFKESVVVLESNSNTFPAGTSQTIRKTHVFLGWSTEKDWKEGDPIFKPGDTIDLKASGLDAYGNITLYAVWEAVTVSPAEVNMQCEGRKIKEWTSMDGQVVLWDNCNTLVVTESMTLRAVGELLTYQIIYDGNGGVTADGMTRYNEGIERSLNNKTKLAQRFTRTGYTFVAWYTNPDFYGEAYYITNDGGYIPEEVNGFVTLYAKWAPVEYTVILDPNTPIGAKRENIKGTFKSYDCTYDEEKKIEGTFSLEGWIFKGWTTGGANGSITIPAGDPLYNVVAKPTTTFLYAVWEVDPYTVAKYVKGDGIDVSDTQSAENGGKSYVIYTNPTNAPQKITGKHVIVDWSTVSNGTYNINKNIVLENVLDIYFMGQLGATYNGLTLTVFGNGTRSDVMIELKNFSMGGAIYQSSDSATLNITLRCSGDSSIVAPESQTAIAGFEKVIFSGSGSIKISGGAGITGKAGKDVDADLEKDAGDGTRGENGCLAVDCSSLRLNDTVKVTLIGGNGGNGGDGGDVTGSSCLDGQPKLGRGGHGGDGGDGGAPIGDNTQVLMSSAAQLLLQHGNGGNGGKGGDGGDASWEHSGHRPDKGGDGGCGGNGGDGFNGGVGGDGGQGGYSYANQSGEKNFWGVKDWVYGACGDGGDGGDGGNAIQRILLQGEVKIREIGSVGTAGIGGEAGERGTKDGSHYPTKGDPGDEGMRGFVIASSNYSVVWFQQL